MNLWIPRTKQGLGYFCDNERLVTLNYGDAATVGT